MKQNKNNKVLHVVVWLWNNLSSMCVCMCGSVYLTEALVYSLPIRFKMSFADFGSEFLLDGIDEIA